MHVRWLGVLLGTLAAACLLGRASARPSIPIIGSQSQDATERVTRALSRFGDEGLASVSAVIFTEADGTLRGFTNGWIIVSPTACAEAWGAPEHHYIVLRDRPDCMVLLTVFVPHEACHLIVGGAHWHDAVWMACFLAHVS